MTTTNTTVLRHTVHMAAKYPKQHNKAERQKQPNTTN